MADIRITPAASIMAFTSSLNYTETLTQDSAGSLTLYGSGSTGRTDIFSVDGNNGRLFSVSDDLSDSLFSVNTIAGLPVIEAFADNTVVMGQYGQNVLVVTGDSVGIGTSNPQSKLHIENQNFAIITLSDTNTSSNVIHSGGNFILATGDNMRFQVNGNPRMYIGNNGYIGIGTTSPGSLLEVNGTVGIGIGGTIEPSAALEIKSNTQGFLPPRMTDSEMLSISSPVPGLIVWNVDSPALFVFDGGSWRKIAVI